MPDFIYVGLAFEIKLTLNVSIFLLSAMPNTHFSDDHQQKWIDKNVIITGGASFIGSHLVDKMVSLGANVTVVDDLSSGNLENLSAVKNSIKFIKKDLEYIKKNEIREIFSDQNIVFHLAAVHGGRGYIQNHPADVCSNLSIDHHVFEAAAESGGSMENLVFASTACVYPPDMQKRIGGKYKLKESDSDPRLLEAYMSADIEYGWGKLMSEMQLNAFINQYGIKGCPVRFVTAYGPRENESHAIIALIYKTMRMMNPYTIWGNGQQERDFTYVEDIVDGTILASERIFDGKPINLGTGQKHKLIDVAETIFNLVDWKPTNIKFEQSMPVGPLSRALDNTRARELLGWAPRFSLEEGLAKTIEWYSNTHKNIKKITKDLLLERVSH
ncbi:MAG TPA: NAD-dependent epimerase/dehydratase family protein [Nitrososphaeraceae archaeon]|nr:NAD-dependent epimerase/dehydratase family protein [Nitrososphaeraceae archaeon]